jgi:hypothetical protein
VLWGPGPGTGTQLFSRSCPDRSAPPTARPAGCDPNDLPHPTAGRRAGGSGSSGSGKERSGSDHVSGLVGSVPPAGVSGRYGPVRPPAGFGPGPVAADLPTQHPAGIRLDRGSRRGDDGGRSETRGARRRTVRFPREPCPTPPDPGSVRVARSEGSSAAVVTPQGAAESGRGGQVGTGVPSVGAGSISPRRARKSDPRPPPKAAGSGRLRPCRHLQERDFTLIAHPTFPSAWTYSRMGPLDGRPPRSAIGRP